MLGSSYWASTPSVINDATPESSQEIKQQIEEPTLMITAVSVPLEFGGHIKVEISPKSGGMPICRSTCETEGKGHDDGQVGASMSVVG